MACNVRMAWEPFDYDPEADTLYVRFTDAEVSRTTALGDLASLTTTLAAKWSASSSST